MKHHSLYFEYTKMRIREKELLSRQEELRKDCAENEDFIEACQRFVSARKKLDEVGNILKNQN
jgi:hypothetical protein